MFEFKVKKLDPKAILPERKKNDSAGLDVYTNESYTLKPGETHAFTTGISTEFDPKYVALIWDRSGLGSKGLHRLAGVIDASYRGEWKIVIYNATQQPYQVKAGDRIAQCLIQEFAALPVREVQELNSSERGHDGFGSTGR